MIFFFNLKGTKKVCFQDVDDKLDDMALSQELKDGQSFNPGSDFIGSAPPNERLPLVGSFFHFVFLVLFMQF